MTARGGAAARAAAAGALATLAACSGAPLEANFRAAQAREAARDLDGALAIYRQVRARCEAPDARQLPHDDCSLAIVREAQVLERKQRFAEAYQAYLAVPRRATDRRLIARALARAAHLAHEELRDDAAAEKVGWAVAERVPDEMGADDGLEIAVRVGARRAPAEVEARLEQLWPQLQKTDLGDNLLWLWGGLKARELGDPAGAVRLWDELAQRYPHSSPRDDAIWHAAELERAAGQPRAALKHLRQILDSRRDALVTGSYNSQYLDDAQLLVGQIHLDDLREVGPAILAFRALADDYKDSTLSDDGLVELARALLARAAAATDDAAREKDRMAACAALERLARKHPDSNRLRQGRALAAEARCATAAPTVEARP